MGVDQCRMPDNDGIFLKCLIERIGSQYTIPFGRSFSMEATTVPVGTTILYSFVLSVWLVPVRALSIFLHPAAWLRSDTVKTVDIKSFTFFFTSVTSLLCRACFIAYFQKYKKISIQLLRKTTDKFFQYHRKSIATPQLSLTILRLQREAFSLYSPVRRTLITAPVFRSQPGNILLT